MYRSWFAIACLWATSSMHAQEVVAPNPSLVTVYHTDFESGGADWTKTGLWSVDGTPSSMTGGAAHSGSQSLNYNNGTNYITAGSQTSGSAKSSLFYVDPTAAHTVTFWCNYQTETTGLSYDKRTVRAYFNSEKTIDVTLFGSSSAAVACGSMGSWHSHTIQIPAKPLANPSALTAHSLQVEFSFDSVDEYANGYKGWFVDDVTVRRVGIVNLPTDDNGNLYSKATSLTVNGSAVPGTINYAGDVDWFKFTTTGPAQLKIDTAVLDDMDSVLFLYDSNGNTQLAYNDNADSYTKASRITYTQSTSSSKTYYIKVKRYPSSGTGSYKVWVTQTSTPTVDDHGNSMSTATAVTLSSSSPVTVDGKIEKGGDVDYFKFTWSQGPISQDVAIETSPSTFDSYLELYDSNGTLLAKDDDSGAGYASKILYAPTTGTYYVKVRHYNSSGTGSYKLTLSSPVSIW